MIRFRPRHPGLRQLAPWALLALGCLMHLASRAEELPEYRLKAAFVYNFIAYAEWPTELGSSINLCIVGSDPFGKEIDSLQGKLAAGRSIGVQRRAVGDTLKNCQAVYFSAPLPESLPRLLEALRGQTVLTMADTPGATRRGVALNLSVSQGKITFEANPAAARTLGVNLNSRLLRLATEVLP